MRKNFRKIDIPLFIMTIIYIIFGLVMIYSASNVMAVSRYGYEPYYFFIRQAIFVGVGLFIGIFFLMQFNTKNYNRLAFPLMVGIIVVLGLVLVYGVEVNSAKSWFDLGYFSVQPSEFAKTIIIIFLAVYYDTLSRQKRVRRIYYFVPLILVGIIIYQVLKQPDLGSALIIAGITFLVIISIPNMQKYKVIKFLKVFSVIALIGSIAFLYSGSDLIEDLGSSRFIFQNPCSRYTEETGYQVCNGFIAINNGGLFGVGLGNSVQKYLYLPESHTDFIFPIIVEELGLITGIFVIIGYIYILWRILKIARSSETLKGSIIAYGTFWYLTLHILINLLGVLALIPLTGVPLPLLSYGGSFNINVIIMLFIVQRVNIENKTIRTKREIENISK